MSKIKFGEYTPDSPDLQDGPNQMGYIEMATANNVLPHATHYGQFPDFVAQTTTAMDSACLGGYSANSTPVSSTVNFVGDTAKLYTVGAASFTDVSKVGGYSTNSDEVWKFCQFGNKIEATNFSNPIQTWDLASSSAFADLAGSPPNCRSLMTVKSAHLVALNTYDAVQGDLPSGVAWCGTGDDTTWVTSPVTLAGSVILRSDAGWINAGVSGEYGTIFQDSAITIMSYEGSPTVFRFDQIKSQKAGTKAGRSVINTQLGIAYYGNDGFNLLAGENVESIGSSKVDQTFARDFNASFQQNVIACVHPAEKIIFWLYPSNDSALGTPDKCIMFNYAPNAVTRWATADIALEFLYPTIDPGYTLEELDSVSSSLDTLPYSLDSRFWQNGAIQLGAINSAHNFGRLTGDALTATLTTKEYQLITGSIAKVNELRPIVYNLDTTVASTIALSSRMLSTTSKSYGTAVSPSSSGVCKFLSGTGRYHSAKLVLTNGFHQAVGINIENVVKVGKR